MSFILTRAKEAWPIFKKEEMVMAEEMEKDAVWEKLKQQMEQKEEFTVTVKESVPGGVVTSVEGIRAFIPVSQLSDRFVEDPKEWIGKEIPVQIITADSEKKNLVLSGKAAALRIKREEKEKKLAELVPGTIVEGTVESIMPYGAFVDLGNGISGLVHISQISRERVESVEAVLTKGQTVRGKVLKVQEGKVSLSMRAIEEPKEQEHRQPQHSDKKSEEYISGEKASTSLSDLLADIKL